MKQEFRNLRLQQLNRTLAAFAEAKNEPRPQRGWLRAVREALGLSLDDVGTRIRKPRQRILEFEEAEAEDRITLKSLRSVAAALDCDLVYAIVPKFGSISELAERRLRQSATQDVLDVEHTMGLEDQASGNVGKLIDDETRRRLKKR
jgi:predicted DNA-binding mobile mystery protein A